MVQMFLWFENFETSAIFLFLCLRFITTIRDQNQTGSHIFKPKKNLNRNIIKCIHIEGGGERVIEIEWKIYRCLSGKDLP